MATAERMGKRPNIVVVFTDQQRATALGCANVENVLTPHLDAFAAQGTRFTRGISNCPLCTPARGSLLTGLHTLSHGDVMNDQPVRTDVPTIAHSLNSEGYRCGYIGKWHLDNDDRGVCIPAGPRRLGFDDFWAVANCNHAYFQGYYYLNDDTEPTWIDDYEPNGQTDLAIDYIRTKADGDDPFCLFLSYGPPHCPYQTVPKKYLDMYPPESIDLLPNAHAEANKAIIAAYYAQCTALDDNFGRVLGALDECGIANDTIVVFTSDHGDMLWSQNRGWKCKPWIESVGVPLIMRWPGRIPAAHETDGPISLVDLMPTLLALSDAPIPAEVEGKDLSAYVCGDGSAAQDSVFINMPMMPPGFFDEVWRGVVTRTHTYARNRTGPWVLYDDAHDPFQLKNLAGAADSVKIETALEGLLSEWLERTHDPFESAEQVREKYIGDRTVGCTLNEKIRVGIAVRLGRVY